jgi:hypothetical protein
MKVLYKNVKTGIMDNKILGLLGKRVDVDLKWFSGDDWKTTPFKDIEIIPWQMQCSKELMGKSRKVMRAPVNFMSLFIKSLQNYIAKIWEKEKFNVVFATSGYDSRLLLWILKSLNLLNNIHVVCYREHKGFCRVADYLKIDTITLLSDNDGYNPTYKNVLNFKKIWKYVGISNYPFNPWMTILEKLKKCISLDLEETRIFITQYHNEWYLRYNSVPMGGNLLERMKEYYYSIYARYATMIDYELIFPIWNDETVDLFLTSVVSFKSRKISQEILACVDKKLAQFPNEGAFQINKEIIDVDCKKMYNAYKKSYYYKLNSIKEEKVCKSIIIDKWWQHYTGAAFLENLVNKEYNVEIVL